MEKQKDIYKRQFKFSILLTTIETIILANTISLIILHPLKMLFSPLSFINNLYEKTTIFYILSGGFHLLARKSKVNWVLHSFLFGFSHFIFTTNCFSGTYFLETSVQQVGFLRKKILINICFAFNIVVSLISGVLCSFRYSFIVNSPTFTHVSGLSIYFVKSSRCVINSIINFYFLDLLFSYWFVAVYWTVLRFFFNLFFVFLRVQLTSKSFFSLFSHVILSNASVLMYYFFVEMINRLDVYNSSLLNNSFTLFFVDEDIDFMRFSFHQLSGLSLRYSYVCREISKSSCTLRNLEEYINLEFNTVKNILDQMITEHKSLDNQLWITVPQVDKSFNKCSPDGNITSHKQHNFTKKYRTYSLLDRLVAKVIYKFKIKKLIYDFNRQMYYVEAIDRYTNYLNKQKDCYLLLGDFERRYTEILKALVESVKKTEQECEIDLKLKIQWWGLIKSLLFHSVYFGF